MGDLDHKLSASIKQTQEILGKYVKKPPLSEKNLARPPFRYLHDIVTNVISGTGFLKGVFSLEELDSANISTREAKSEFMQKLIKAIKDATGEDVTAKVSKILAGQEADKTNELLQALARAIEKNGGVAGKPSKAADSKAKGKDQKPMPGARDKKPVGKTGAPVRAEASNTKAKPANAVSTLKGKSDDKPKRGIRDATAANKAGGDTKGPESRTRAGNKAGVSTKASTLTEKKPEVLAVEQISSELPPEEIDEPIVEARSISLLGEPVEDAPGSRKNTASSSRSSAIKRQNSSKALGIDTNSMSMVETPENNSGVRTKSVYNENHIENKAIGDKEAVEIVHDDDDDQHVALYNDFKNSSIKPNMETLTLPTTPIFSDASALQIGVPNESPDIVDDLEIPVTPVKSGRDRSPIENKFGMSSTPGPSGSILSKIDEMESQDDFGKISSPGENGRGASQAKNRPGTGSARMTSARPPSARPAPPRPRSSMFKEAEESSYRPPTGKVTNVLLESTDNADDEDDNFIVREASISKGPGLSDLDETPELALTSGAKLEDQIDEILPPEQRGFLVNQILETQKELLSKENKDKAKVEFSADRSITREVTTAEIEKLKNLIQDCARNANPVGKLLDYVREDMDAMQKELSKWREESRQLDSQLELAKQQTEASLQPLQQQLMDVEGQIRDKEDAIAATKMAILRHQDRIEKILSGLDRVSTSHGKITIPSASEILHDESDPDQAILTENEKEDTGFSSGFGSTLNQFSRASTAMRPSNSNLFNTTDGDLDDPDNFDPWKE